MIATDSVASDRTATHDEIASLRARAGGYVVDMVIFGAVAMVVVVIAGFVLLASTGWAEEDPSDAAVYLFLGVIGAGVPLTWSALNLALLAMRRQTGGQYVAGVRLAREDGAPLSFGAIALWWFCFNPLLLSWPMAAVVGFPLVSTVLLVVSTGSLVIFGLIVILCIVTPIVAFVAALLDAKNRGLHDRVVGTVVVPVVAP